MRRVAVLYVLLLAFAGTASAKAAGNAWVEGKLVYVTTTEVKLIDDLTRQLVSIPLSHFAHIISEDGRTSIPPSALHHNEVIRVYYNQAREADRIVVIKRRQ